MSAARQKNGAGLIHIAGIEIQVTRKKMKNMYLRVLPPDGRVCISAPRRSSDSVVLDFAASRLEWIKKQQRALRERPLALEPEYVSGEEHLVWGQSCRLELRPGAGRCRVELEGGRLTLYAPESAGAAERAQALNAWRRAELEAALPQLVKKWEGIVGVQAAEWRIRNMRTRWGSCNPWRGRVWLNLQLSAQPQECLEYIIAHELVHFLEIRHNERFRAFMDQFYPEWRNIRRKLNRRAPA